VVGENWNSDEVSKTGAVEHPGDVVGLGLLTVHGLDWCRPWSFCRTQGPRASRIIIFSEELSLGIDTWCATESPGHTSNDNIIHRRSGEHDSIVHFCLKKEAEDDTTAESTSKTSCAMVLPVEWHERDTARTPWQPLRPPSAGPPQRPLCRNCPGDRALPKSCLFWSVRLL
jgi:hypothetical protein